MTPSLPAPRGRVRSFSRSRRRRRRRRLVLAFTATLVAAALGILTYSRLPDWSRQRGHTTGQLRAAVRGLTTDIVRAENEPARPIYRHSVIPGGVYSSHEVARALERDAVAAAHYASLDLTRLRTERVRASRLVYVSYRLNERIYWTRHPVLLRQGETILTDGTTTIRARCGNCVSDEPNEATTEDEPAPNELDEIEPSPSLVPSHVPERLLPSRGPLFPLLPYPTVPTATASSPLPRSNPRASGIPAVSPVDLSRSRKETRQIPEPATMLLLGSGAVTVLAGRWVRNARRASLATGETRPRTASESDDRNAV